MNKVLVMVFMSSVLWAGVTSHDYCLVPCKERNSDLRHKHTMCRYPTENPGDKCTDFEDFDLSSAAKDLILNKHNAFRNRVATGQETRGLPGPQPPAANMRQLRWDDELEKIAKRWALQCDVGHDACRQTYNKTSVGQSNALSYNRHSYRMYSNIQGMIDQFIQQVQYVDGNSIRRSPWNTSREARHYTQMVWADTDRIGCARVFFNHYWEAKCATLRTEYLVCNYAKSAKVAGSPPYAVGKHCSKCPSGWSCSDTYPGLCEESAKKNTSGTSDTSGMSGTSGTSGEVDKVNVQNGKGNKPEEKAKPFNGVMFRVL